MKNIQVFKPFYRTQEVLDLIKDCCEEGWLGIGGRCTVFEENFRQFTGVKYAYFLNSATAGLDLAFKQLKLKYLWNNDSEVITSSLTFISSNHALLYNNLKPIFADIDEYGCLDPQSVKEKINSKTKAVLFIGLGGNIGKLKEIIAICKENNLKLVLDAAHMMGTKIKDTLQHVMTLEGITTSILSFQVVKNLSMADGGMIIYSNEDAEELDMQARKLGWLGISKTTDARTSSNGAYKWHYDCDLLGHKFHGNSIMACFGIVGLKYLEQDNAYRRYLADLYTLYLKDIVKIVSISPECIPSRHLFQILVDNRDEVMLALNQCGIYPGVHYRVNTIYPMYSYAHGTCPKAEEFSNKTITLPCHMHITVEDVKYICDSLKKILNK